MSSIRKCLLNKYELIKSGGNCRLKSEKIGAKTMEMKEISPKMKMVLLVLNCIMLAVGICAGPLVMRLYYIHGGKSIWLSSCLETAGFPFMIFPLLTGFFSKRRIDPNAKLFSINGVMFIYACLLGLIAGTADYVYAFGVKQIPVSTSSLILATQLAFTAGFCYVLVGQKFTAYSINAVALLTFGAAVLALHVSSDKPEGVSMRLYYMGFFFTLAAAALFAILLPLVELVYKKSKQTVDYSMVVEIQLVLSLSATVVCSIGIFASGDYKTYAEEFRNYELGSGMYIFVQILSALVWQFFYLGAVGVIYYGNSLLSGIIISLGLPLTEILAVICYHEKFQVEKGVSLALSLWGFISYFYGEAKESKKQKKREMQCQSGSNIDF